jgi:hypothetical protein
MEDHINQIRLVHFSVKEYFLSDQYAFRLDFAKQAGHRKIAEGYLHCLLHVGEHAPLTKEESVSISR